MVKIFDYTDYREYLADWILDQSKKGYGLRKQIAEYLHIQGAFISQVLSKKAQLSLEHGCQLNEFLEHPPAEADYFLLLMHYKRAGSNTLRHYYHAKIEQMRKERLLLEKRISTRTTLGFETKARYYSAWYYGAIRVLLALPGFNTKEAIAKRLKLSPRTVDAALAFLVEYGLAFEEDGKCTYGEAHMHISSDSPFSPKHHSNWRVQALRAVDEPRESDLHYSLVLAISQEDALRLKAMIVDFLEKLQEIARPSPSETLMAFCLDWFGV